MSDLEDSAPVPVSISEADSEGNRVTWVAAEGLGSVETHRRMLELLFSPRLGS